MRIQRQSERTVNRKAAEREVETTIGFLRLVNEARSEADLVRASAAFFEEQSGCESVSIRLRNEDYARPEARGFLKGFVTPENSLQRYHGRESVLQDTAGNPIAEPVCGEANQGRFDASKPFSTAKGSLWMNRMTGLPAPAETGRLARTRKRRTRFLTNPLPSSPLLPGVSVLVCFSSVTGKQSDSLTKPSRYGNGWPAIWRSLLRSSRKRKICGRAKKSTGPFLRTCEAGLPIAGCFSTGTTQGTSSTCG